MEMKEYYSTLIANADNGFVEVLTMEQVENGVFVTFGFGDTAGNFDGVTAAVIYDDDTIFTPTDWQSPEQPKKATDIEKFEWMELESHKKAIVLNDLPRMF